VSSSFIMGLKNVNEQCTKNLDVNGKKW
jgi:hypothetical protein